ncbi:MAG: ricin-type beta-trefoil lectin domain protein, partial [Candidatus Saccharimonadales bacterium]
AKRNQKGFTHLLIMLVVSAFLIWASVAVASLRPASADAPISEFRSGQPGYCLSASSSKIASGTPAVVTLCNGSSAQNFSLSGEHIIIEANYCLSAVGSSVEINSCNVNSVNQDWKSDSVSYLNLANNNCLSLTNDNISKPLVTASCANLESLSETWVPSVWSGNSISNSSDPTCNQSDLGQRVACMAKRQWLTWQTDPKLHPALLYDYTAGNSNEEWCADFVSYIYMQAGAPFSNGERGQNGWDEYDANNIINQGFTYHSVDSGYIPSPGDIAYFNYQDGHVEIVVSGGAHPTFIYGDSGVIDPITGNGDMAENQITSDGNAGQLEYYLSPIY